MSVAREAWEAVSPVSKGLPAKADYAERYVPLLLDIAEAAGTGGVRRLLKDRLRYTKHGPTSAGAARLLEALAALKAEEPA